jgi:hypothetical protein
LRDGAARLRREPRPAAAAGVELDPRPLGETQAAIIDDHTPFLRAGILAVDLIDWSYPGHSRQDTLDKLSPQSVDAVGETLVQFVRRLDDERG